MAECVVASSVAVGRASLSSVRRRTRAHAFAAVASLHGKAGDSRGSTACVRCSTAHTLGFRHAGTILSAACATCVSSISHALHTMVRVVPASPLAASQTQDIWTFAVSFHTDLENASLHGGCGRRPVSASGPDASVLPSLPGSGARRVRRGTASAVRASASSEGGGGGGGNGPNSEQHNHGRPQTFGER